MLPLDKDAYANFAKGEVPGQYDLFCAPMYAIDTSLPIISFGQRERWHPRAAPVAAVQPPKGGIYGTLCEASFTRHWDFVAPETLAVFVSVYRWVHIALGWLLAAM